MSDAPTPANLAGRLVADARVDMDDVDADIEADVEAALGQLEALPDLAVTDHVAVFEGVQQRLSEILSNVDDANLRLRRRRRECQFTAPQASPRAPIHGSQASP